MLHLIAWHAFNFRQAVHNAVNKQAVKHISYLLGDSPDNSSLSRIIELSTKGNGELEESTLTELSRIFALTPVPLFTKAKATQSRLTHYDMRKIIEWKTHSLSKPIFSLVCVVDKADEAE